MKLKPQSFKYKKTIRNGIILAVLLAALGYTIYSTYYPQNASTSIGDNGASIVSPPSNNTPSELKTVYCASTDLAVGTFVDADNSQNFYTLEIPINEIPSDAIYDLNILKDTRLKKTLAKDGILTSSSLIKATDWYEDGDRFIEQQFLEGVIPSTYGDLVGKYVDIVLFRVNAEDPVVISKTVIVSATETRLGFHLNPQEREFLKEAAIENGGFYIQIYLDEVQTASPVTYVSTYN